ncbi:MAG: thioredoxin family protein [Planctomycetota bacterium]
MDCTGRDQNQELRARYGVNGVPTVLFLDPQGEVVGRLGARDPQSLIQAIEAAVGGSSE